MESEPGEAAPIIEETGATLNNPGEAEQGVIPPSSGLSEVGGFEDEQAPTPVETQVPGASVNGPDELSSGPSSGSVPDKFSTEAPR